MKQFDQKFMAGHGGVVEKRGVVGVPEDRVIESVNMDANVDARDKTDSNIKNLTPEELVKNNPQEAVVYAMEKISEGDIGKGIDVAEEIIELNGWSFFLERVVNNILVEKDVAGRVFILNGLKECIHKLGNPNNLPITKIE